MRIRTKLILFMMLIVIVPAIAINIVLSSQSEEKFTQTIENNIASFTSNRGISLNFYFEEITASAKELASSENLKKYVADTNINGSKALSENEYYSEIESALETIIKYDSSLQKIMVINNSGDIVASTDPENIGQQMPNYSGLITIASEKNGVSPLFLNGEDNDSAPVFIVVKSIYSYDNERQGIVYQLYDTSYIQKLIANVQYEKYTTPAVMDSSGNVFEYPYRTIKTYSNTENYKNASDFLKNIINPSGDEQPANDSYEYKVSRGTRVIFSSEIPVSGWTMLTISDKFSIADEVGKNSNSIRNFSIILTILSLVGCGLFIYFFTKPLTNIMDTLRKKLKGDSNAKFEVDSKDEFREIGGVFETVFEDVFELEQRYKTIVEITNNIVFEVNLKNGMVTVSKNFNKKFSHRPKDDSLTESFIYKLRVHKDDKEQFTADFDRILGQANSIQGEYRVKSIYGDFIWVMIKATKFYNRDEIPIKIMGVIMDIDKEKKSEIHLIQRASLDALTQLYNRETFIKTLGAELELAASKKTLDALMFIDLDDFKFFNDEYGHACGDEVLKFVADTLKEICFEHGFAGRFGGDEFVICVTDLTLYGDSGKIAQEIIDTLGNGFISESTGVKLNIHCSVGIAFLRESGKTTEEVIGAADEAMYNIKKHGKSAFAYAKSHSASDETFADDVIT